MISQDMLGDPKIAEETPEPVLTDSERRLKETDDRLPSVPIAIIMHGIPFCHIVANNP